MLKDSLAELERDHAAGTIGRADYEQAKLELKRRLLEDTALAEDASPSAARRRPLAAVATAIALPIAAAGLYLVLGSPAALDPEQRQPQLGRADVEAMVEKLAQRLQNRPDDAEGWAMLGRSYRVLGRNEEAAQAFAKAEKVVAADPRLLVDYAESLALAHGGNLQGKPAQLVARALELDPGNPLALMLSGAVSFQREDYAGAIREWQKVQALLAPESEEARAVGDSIAKARELAAAQPPSKAPAGKAARAKVAGTVRLARRAGVESGADRHRVRLRARCGRSRRAARGHAPPGEGPAARVLARRHDGDGAGPEALRRGGSGRGCADLAVGQPAAAERRPAGPVAAGEGGRVGRRGGDRYRGAVAAGAS